MTNRFPTTNLLLLLVLASILFVSGSLQCAFDCLTESGQQRSVSIRVDGCHPTPYQPTPTLVCVNKACHRGSPQHQDLGGPQIYSFNRLPQPLTSTSRLQLPQLRTAAPLLLPAFVEAPLLAANNPEISTPSQQLRSIRTTVLLN